MRELHLHSGVHACIASCFWCHHDVCLDDQASVNSLLAITALEAGAYADVYLMVNTPVHGTIDSCGSILEVGSSHQATQHEAGQPVAQCH